MNGGNTSRDDEGRKSGNAAALLENLRAANQLLSRQAVTLTLICLLTSGLMYLSDAQWKENQELYEKIQLLESLRDAPDLQAFIEKNHYELSDALYHEIDLDALYFQLARADYADRLPVVEAISLLKERRRGLWGISNQSISVFGASIPIGSLTIFVPVILFVLMHKLTATIYYRQAVRRQLAEIEEISEGPELFGFIPRSGTRPFSEAYVRLLSALIAAGFLLLPAATSFLFVFSSYSNRQDYQRASSDLALTVNWVCLLLTIVDAALIAYQENLFRVSSAVGQVLPGGESAARRHPSPLAKIIVFTLPVVLVWIHFVTVRGFVPFYLGTIALMSAAFPASWLLVRARPGNRFARSFFFSATIVLLFWLSIPPLVWTGFLAYSHANPTEMAQLAWAIAFGAWLLGLMFSGLGRGRRAGN